MSDDRRDQLLQHLADCNLPGELVAWLRHGFEVHQAGGDLLAALELPGPDLNRRDDMIREVVGLSLGETLTARCCYFLDCLDGKQTHHRNDMQRVVELLQRVAVPRTKERLRGIVKAGERNDSPFVSLGSDARKWGHITHTAHGATRIQHGQNVRRKI